jgi:predicted amidohydrolase YtcJ
MSAGDFENFDKPRPELSPAMEQQLKQVISLLVKNRWPFRLHATYDESISRFLNVIEEVNTVTPLDGLLWFFDHAETVSEKNLLRIKALGGGIAIQYRMAFQGENFIKRYGKKAAEFTPPVRKMLDMGIPVGMGSDGTRVSSYNPFIGLYWLTTGKTIGGTRHMNPENMVDRTTALMLYTQGSAALIRLQQDRGQLKAGFLADFAILSDDYFKVPDERLLQLESVLTVMNGEVVYASGDFKTMDSTKEEIKPDWSPVKYFGGYQKQ